MATMCVTVPPALGEDGGPLLPATGILAKRYQYAAYPNLRAKTEDQLSGGSLVSYVPPSQPNYVPPQPNPGLPDATGKAGNGYDYGPQGVAQQAAAASYAVRSPAVRQHGKRLAVTAIKAFGRALMGGR